MDLCGMYRMYGLNKFNASAARCQRQSTVALISYLPQLNGGVAGRRCGRASERGKSALVCIAC